MKSFWKSIHFWRVMVWCDVNWKLIHFSKHPFHQVSIFLLIHFLNKIILVQNRQCGNELNQFFPPKSSDDLCLLICLYLFSKIAMDSGQSFLVTQSLADTVTPMYCIKRKTCSYSVKQLPGWLWAAVWGAEFINFLDALAILYMDEFEEQYEFILFFKSSWCNSSYSSNHPSAKQLAQQ